MSSLTPHERNQEVASAATHEGLVNGFIALIPSMGAVALAMRNPAFVKRTNWQSRTAMAIMPPLFVFGFTAEHSLSHQMQQMAEENRHSKETVRWAEQQMKLQRDTINQTLATGNGLKIQQQQAALQDHQHTEAAVDNLHLTELYQRSISESGVQVVPGDTLRLHHRVANYITDNPIKVLAGVAVPSVAAILYGRSGQEHLAFSVKLMHTRVFGQFATISLLLSVMGFKEFMDRHGKYITEADAAARVEEMHRVRANLMERLEYQRQLQEALKQEIEQAHAEDVKEGHVKKSRHQKDNKEHDDSLLHA